MSWTEERIDRLKAMWAKGATASQIAEDIGGVSRNAVIGKAHRLGLEQRPSPVKAGEDKKAAASKPAPPAAPKPSAKLEAPLAAAFEELPAAPVAEPDEEPLVLSQNPVNPKNAPRPGLRKRAPFQRLPEKSKLCA